MQLPEIPDKIPIKKRKILGPIARLLLSKYNWSIVGKFPNRKKMILIGAPHTAHRDAWFGLLVVLALDLRVNFFGAKWMFSRLPSPFRKTWIDWVCHGRWVGCKNICLYDLEAYQFIEKKTKV